MLWCCYITYVLKSCLSQCLRLQGRWCWSCGRCDKIIVLLGVTVLLGVVCRVVVVLWTVWYVVGWVVDRVRGWESEKTLS